MLAKKLKPTEYHVASMVSVLIKRHPMEAIKLLNDSEVTLNAHIYYSLIKYLPLEHARMFAAAAVLNGKLNSPLLQCIALRYATASASELIAAYQKNPICPSNLTGFEGVVNEIQTLFGAASDIKLPIPLVSSSIKFSGTLLPSAWAAYQLFFIRHKGEGFKEQAAAVLSTGENGWFHLSQMKNSISTMDSKQINTAWEAYTSWRDSLVPPARADPIEVLKWRQRLGITWSIEWKTWMKLIEYESR